MRGRAARAFWFGLALLLVGAVTATLSVPSEAHDAYVGGHYVSAACVIGGLLAFYVSRRRYWAMVELGGEQWRSSTLNLAVLGGSIAVLLAVVTSVNAVSASASPTLGPAGVGSCWDSGNGTFWQVSCDDPHAYRASGLVAYGTPCPNAADAPFALADGSGNNLCLTPDSAATTAG